MNKKKKLNVLEVFRKHIREEIKYKQERIKYIRERAKENEPLIKQVHKILLGIDPEWIKDMFISENFVSIQTGGEVLSTQIVHKMVAESEDFARFVKLLKNTCGEKPEWEYKWEKPRKFNESTFEISIHPSPVNPDCKAVKKVEAYTYTSGNWSCDLH